MLQPGLLSLLLLLGLAGAAPLSKQEVTRCFEEALKDKLTQGGPREAPCTQLLQEDEQLASLLRTLEELRHREISKHHLGPESAAEREEQEEAEEEDFRKKKRRPGEVEGEKRLGQEVREEKEEEVKAKEKSEIREQEVRGQARTQEEDRRKRRGPAEAWVSQESFEDLRKRRPEGARGSEEEETEAWGQDVEKRMAEKASDEETAQFEEEKGVRVLGGGRSSWQGAGPAHRQHHHQPHPEQETEEEEEEEAEKKVSQEGQQTTGDNGTEGGPWRMEEQHELERLEQMGEELKRAAEALGRRG
ncbi:coiled-coil domain-containing glutamate-rich protein 2 isoform X2 [Dromiciops gliroides]|uniref:coiled-coil domain-containing glutamate-rich protein 2 isoform X2 n=1 Tax=Dromiciops gliroides TaxID=33562 RepID=UPI001CC4E079|nr:coiled-coil domain-containing glutamate-rich protein 2 isoform X2 [Dromiciops gliroides]